MWFYHVFLEFESSTVAPKFFFVSISAANLDITVKDGKLCILGDNIVSHRDKPFHGDIRQNAGVSLFVRADVQTSVTLL